MVELNDAQLTPEKARGMLQEWYKMQEQMKSLRAKEMILRKALAEFYFDNPKEGTNRLELGDGYDLKLDYKLTRDIDVAALNATKSDLEANGLPVDRLVEYKPFLVKREYNKLTAGEQATFDTVLRIKPGSPALDVVKGKVKK